MSGPPRATGPPGRRARPEAAWRRLAAGTVERVTEAPAGLRAQRKEETRAAIRAAAFRLFADKGYEATTVDDIAAAADVSPRTFFRYFPTKDDVVFNDHPERLEDLRRMLAARPDDEPILDSVREVIRSLAGDMDAKHDQIVASQQMALASSTLAARSLALQRELTDIITEFVADRMGVDPVTDQVPGLVGGVVFAAVVASMNTWVATGARDDLLVLVERALELLDSGLGLPESSPRRR